MTKQTVKILVRPALTVAVRNKTNQTLTVSKKGVAGPPGPQGDPGGSMTAGPGFIIVGDEIRFDIESLPRG
jgi:hypothetical protein